MEIATDKKMPLFHTIKSKDVWSTPLLQHRGIVLSLNKNYDESEILEFHTYDGKSQTFSYCCTESLT